jgi:alanine or glycine:cation symporter, AGCS family
VNRTKSPLIAIFLSVLLCSASSVLAQEPPAAPPKSELQVLSSAEPKPTATTPRPEESVTFESRVDKIFKLFNGVVAAAVFFPVPLTTGDKPATAPLAVLWLVFGAVFLTLRMGFINFRGFRHAIDITMGKYDRKEDAGEVNHFQALSTALSATVGMGNIAGVATAIGLGGPGACFWLIVAGLLGMTAKMAECTLGQMYREIRPDGRVMGGAMFYLTRGLSEIGLRPLGLVLGYAFVVMCIGGSFAGGNSYQVNQSLGAISQTFPILKQYPWVYGLLMTGMTGVVILGGLKWIAGVAEKIVPFMCGLYILMSLTVLAMNFTHIPLAALHIVQGAFSPDAIYGGVIGVMVIGFQRAAFSNEAGVGSAAIAHSAAKTPYPVREGIVALLEPFIDTVIVCTMTALVMVITESYDRGNPELAPLIAAKNGAAITSRAFGSQLPIFAYLISLIVFLFAYSTQISWSYYGERCWAYLFGDGASLWYRLIFLVFTFLGSIVTATQMLDFGDLMILGMAFPNLIGVLLLSGKIRAQLDDYWTRFRAGEFEPVRK